MSKLLFVLSLVATSFLFVKCSEEPTKQVEVDLNNILVLDSLLKVYPDSVDLLVLRGNMALKEYRYFDALADGAKAFRLDSLNTSAVLLFAQAQNNKPNRTVTDVENAQKHFIYVIKKEPKNIEALVALATTYGFQQDFDNAFKYTNEALKIDPHYRDAYVFKGSIYLNIGDTELAKTSYETAVQQDPKFYEGYIMLGNIYSSEKNLVAIEYYTTAQKIAPEELETTYALAYAQEEFDQLEEATRNYRLLSQNGNDRYYEARGLFHLGYIKQFAERDIDSALFFYASATRTDPTYVEAYHNMGLCYEEKGNKSQALLNYSNALKQNPNFTLSKEAAERLR